MQEGGPVRGEGVRRVPVVEDCFQHICMSTMLADYG